MRTPFCCCRHRLVGQHAVLELRQTSAGGNQFLRVMNTRLRRPVISDYVPKASRGAARGAMLAASVLAAAGLLKVRGGSRRAVSYSGLFRG